MGDPPPNATVNDGEEKDSHSADPIPIQTKIIDLTHSLISSHIPACSGHPSYTAHRSMSLSKGEFANVHTLLIGTHTGTHIDAPYHFFEDGITVDELDLNLLTAAPAVVVDLRNKVAHERITWEGDLRRYEERMKEGVVVLLCTGWSKNWCKPNYSDHPFLDPGAAEKIMERGIKVIGIDAMSPDEVTEEGGDCGKVHRAVLGNGGIIIENLNDLGRILESGIEGEELRVSVLPLRLDKCDGSPVRAVAWAV